MDSLEAVWWWRDPSSQWFSKVLDHIKSFNGFDNDQPLNLTVLHCEDITDPGESIPLTNYFFDLYLRMNALKDDRIMFLNIKDLISSIELHLTMQKKKHNCVDTDVQDEEILNFYNEYVASYQNEDFKSSESITVFKELLKKNNCVDINVLHDFYLKCKKDIISSYLDVHKYLILGTPSSSFLKQFINTLGIEKIYSISMEVPLDVSLHGAPNSQTSENIEISQEPIDIKDIPINYDSFTFGSATEEYVEDLILSFLSLLINNKNELALSKVMISPVINFSHAAFTALKHLSVEKEMPMCQVAVSYVTRLRLGGKGYAPPADCPMLPHLKGLELFVDILNQLQTVIEEVSSPLSAVKKLMNILKKKLLKCGNEKLKSDSIEIATEKLQAIFLSKIEMFNSRVSNNSVQICQGTLDVLYHFINFMYCNSFISDPEVIFSKKKAKRTPLNLPPLLGYFRSPDEESSCDSRITLNEDSVLSTTSVTKVQHVEFNSYFHNSESSAASCVNSSTPSKLTFKGCLNESTEQSLSEKKIKVSGNYLEDTQDSMPTKKNRKRCILSEITNEDLSANKNSESVTKKDSKKTNKVLNNNAKENSSVSSAKKSKKETKKGLKKFKQIQGQAKITSFFVMNK